MGTHQRLGSTEPVVGGVFTLIGMGMFALGLYAEIAHWRRQRRGE